MRFFLLIVSSALIIAAVNCEESEKEEPKIEAQEEEAPVIKEVCQLNFGL